MDNKNNDNNNMDKNNAVKNSGKPNFLEEFMDEVRFCLSKEELERQTCNVHSENDLSPRVSFKRFSSMSSSSISQSPDCTSTLNNHSTGRTLDSETKEELMKPRPWAFEKVDGYFLPMPEAKKIAFERQEQLLMRDLIYAFSGVPATYIKPDMSVDQIAELTPSDLGKLRFKIDDDISLALRNLVAEVLPLIGYYICVQSFIEEISMTPKCGRGRQALVNSLQEYMLEYFELQSKLETELHEEKLTLQKLIHSVRPLLTTMQTFANVAGNVRHGQLNTAGLLTLLDDMYKKQKDKNEPPLHLEKVLMDTSYSYMKIVQLWTQKGVLYDPQRDFFIEDRERANAMSSTLLAPEQCCVAYWKQRYVVHMERLPNFLKPHVKLILNAGKYLNVLRQCNVQLKLLQQPLNYNPNDNNCALVLRNSYDLAACKLRDVIVEEEHLQVHMDNIGRFFLLQQFAFTDKLIEKLDRYLKRTVDLIIPETLQGIIKEVLQEPQCAEGTDSRYNDLLQIQMMNINVDTHLSNVLDCANTAEQSPFDSPLSNSHGAGETDALSSNDDIDETAFNMYGYEAFTYSYATKWPFSMVLHAETINKLQLLHRILFFQRYVQRQLSNLWQLQTQCIIHTTRSMALRQRMLSTMLALDHYMCRDVIAERWVTLQMNLTSAPNVDELISKFQSFIDACLAKCLLSEASTFVCAIFTLGHVCLNYCRFIQEPPGGSDYEEFERSVIEYEQEFNSFMLSIMALVSELVNTNKDEFCELLLRRLDAVIGNVCSSDLPTSSDRSPLT